jgi:hypothetical protein
MKSIQSKIYLLLFILMSINAIPQNNLFEKVFQNGYANYDVKILKRDTTGFAVFTESIGAVASPFGSANTVFTCNDTGFVIKKISLDSIIPMWGERFEILDWHLTTNGNYLVNYFGRGCDFGFPDSSLIFNLTPTGNLLWSKKGLIVDNFNGKTGLLKYLNGYLNYNLPSLNGLPTETVKFMFCDDIGNTRNMAECNNNNYIQLYSNITSLYAINIDTNNNEQLFHIDTLGNIFQSHLLGSGTNFYTKRNFAFQQDKILASYNSSLYLLNDTLALLQQQSLSSAIIKLEFDAAGNIWVLLENGDLISFDTNLNIINTINLMNISTNIYLVNWFNIDIPKNRIYYGGYAAGQPFIKSLELSTFNQFQNANNILVTATQITNAIGNLIYQQPTAPVYGFTYEFDVAATIKNTGNTIVQKVFLNCSQQIGNYICNPPFLCKQFNNLNLLPGDSINLAIGHYVDYGIYIPITNVPNPYTRSNFCVWPSSPNDTWMHDSIQFYCQDVEIAVLIGVNVNDLGKLQSDINISPNPSSNQIMVKLPTNYTPTEISIINITGEIIAKYYNIENSSLTIDVASLSNGIYFLQLNDGKNMVRKKFVKSN